MKIVKKVDDEENVHNCGDAIFKRPIVDNLIRILNLIRFLFIPRNRSNFRWANVFKDRFDYVRDLAEDQFTTIYGRITARYNYHSQQRFHNAPRKFNLSEELKNSMAEAKSSKPFYQAIGDQSFEKRPFPKPDFTKLSDIDDVSSSADYLYKELLAIRGENIASVARKCYVRGYSRPILASSHDDWEKFREELFNTAGEDSVHLGAGLENDGDDVLPLAISYKSKEVKISRRMRKIDKDGKVVEDEGLLLQTDKQMTDDFLQDFRWSQLVRSCMELAYQADKSHVRLWIDRLVMMNVSRDERKRIYEIVHWQEFGLFAYAVCPVIRLYEREEPYFGTDFWRKLETVMGVAGNGLVADDYMLRKYDHTIFFGPDLYTRLPNGLCIIGGEGVYLRAVTLALATALLTDGISVSQANEDMRTKKAASSWKAWALRTIAEGAYSRNHTSMLPVDQEPMEVTLEIFEVILFWESMVSKCDALEGHSYLDMSIQRSKEWRKNSSWDGVVEWVGMIRDSCKISASERAKIMAYLNMRTSTDTRIGTTGHTGCILDAVSQDGNHKRSLVVSLSRFSRPRRGHVTAVAEATGLWRERILPWYFKFEVDPDKSQSSYINDKGRVVHERKDLEVEFRWNPILRALLLLTLFLATFIIVAVEDDKLTRSAKLLRLFLGLGGTFLLSKGSLDLSTTPNGDSSNAVKNIIQVSGLVIFYTAFFLFAQVASKAAFLVVWIGIWIIGGFLFFLHVKAWPWVDKTDVGEALFDNLLLHSLFRSGIKRQYKRLRSIDYEDICWS